MAKKPTTEGEALAKVEPLAKLLGKTAGQIWKVFVMRYVGKGLGEIFLAVALVVVCHGYFGYNKWMMLGSFVISGVFVYDAIQLLIDPWYFAMNDVAVRLKSEQLFLKGK